MTTILVLRFHNLPLPPHFEFFHETNVRLMTADEAIRKAIAALLPEFQLRLAIEQAVYRWLRKSSLTVKITAADEDLDSVLVLINSGVDFGRRSPQPAIAASGKRVREMIKAYGPVTRKSYDAKAGAVRELLDHFTSDYAHDIDNLGLGTQVQMLQTALDTFVNLLGQRDAERVNKPPYTAKEARKGMENAWASIVYAINSHAGVGKSPAFAEFIDHINTEITRLNVEFSHSRKDISAIGHLVSKLIGAQIYTGQPVIVIPEIYYIDDKGKATRLWLGKDFDVSFRNNTKVGTAEVTVHGKGRYKGRVSQTFEIRRQEEG
jgi:hypothetical protein